MHADIVQESGNISKSNAHKEIQVQWVNPWHEAKSGTQNLWAAQL